MSSAAGVAITRGMVACILLPLKRNGAPRPQGRASTHQRSEEAHRLRVVAHQQVLGLLIMLEHHLVVFTADARLLVTAERGMRRIQVIAVRPYAAGVDFAADAEGTRGVARPQAGAEAVQRVVGD